MVITIESIVAVLALFVVVLGGACSFTNYERARPDLPGPADLHRSWEEWKGTNPCGALELRRPFLNVSGYLTSPAIPGASIRLYVSPNVSFESALYALENCSPITRGEIIDSSAFWLPALPRGTFVVAVPHSAFVGGRGLPIVSQANRSGLTVGTVLVASTEDYSFAAFFIHTDPRVEVSQ